MTGARAPRPLPRAEVVGRRDVTPDLFVLWLRPDVPYTFIPGQYCTIGIDGSERPYSIVSAPHEPALEVFVELVPHGELTPRLDRLRPGDVVDLRPRAKGLFTLASEAASHLMVATVTGIAPFVSMLRDAVHRGALAARFVVLHGGSYQDELAHRDELDALAARHPGTIAYVPTVSRPGADRNRGWRGATGRVDTLVEGAVVRFGLAPAGTAVYACGHPGMVEHVGRRLGPKGFAVREERFWPA
jgi:ferredoxin-NADP reductase